MNEHMKDNIIFFLIGILIGIMGTSFCGVIIYKTIKGGGFPNPLSIMKKSSSTMRHQKLLKLNFDNKEDLKMMNPSDNTKIELAVNPVSKGSKSLHVEMDAYGQFPGVSWETYGRNTQNWSKEKNFTMDVYNATENYVKLEVKFKSGKNYPKKSFSYPIELDPLKMNNIQISIQKINQVCDISNMSYVKIFAQNPQKTINLYFNYIGTK